MELGHGMADPPAPVWLGRRRTQMECRRRSTLRGGARCARPPDRPDHRTDPTTGPTRPPDRPDRPAEVWGRARCARLIGPTRHRTTRHDPTRQGQPEGYGARASAVVRTNGTRNRNPEPGTGPGQTGNGARASGGCRHKRNRNPGTGPGQKGMAARASACGSDQRNTRNPDPRPRTRNHGQAEEKVIGKRQAGPGR